MISETSPGTAPLAQVEEEFRVLVVNSSQEMAKEITMQLNLNLPGCSITYSPSIDLARWVLSRRKIHLVIASPILPDGNISRLQDVLKKKQDPPDLLVVGTTGISDPDLLGLSGYKFSTCRRLGESLPKIHRPRHLQLAANNDVDTNIKTLGADLRNDLNNPLQEIVAMVFVAKAGGESSPATSQALEAIDNAAKNMANVVKRLEDKIRDAVKH